MMPIKFLVDNFKEHIKDFPEDIIYQDTSTKIKMYSQEERISD